MYDYELIVPEQWGAVVSLATSPFLSYTLPGEHHGWRMITFCDWDIAGSLSTICLRRIVDETPESISSHVYFHRALDVVIIDSNDVELNSET